MPNVIITPGFAALRARLAEDRYGAIAQGVVGTTNIIAGTLLDYVSRKRQDETERLSLLNSLVDYYGASAPQSLLQQLDDAASKKGVRLPKDPNTGEYLGKPKSFDEKLQDEIVKDPAAIHSMAVKKATGLSPFEQGLKERDLQIKEEKVQMEGQIYAIRAETAQLTARTAAAKAAEPGLYSSTILLPDGKIIADTGQYADGQIPEGAKQLTNRELGNMSKVVRDSRINELRDLDIKQKRLEEEAVGVGLAHQVLFGKGQAFVKIMQKVADGKENLTPQEKAVYKYGLTEVMKDVYRQQGKDPADIDKEVKKPGWFESWFGPRGKATEAYRQLPQQLKDEAQATATAPDLQPSAGKEVIPGVVYKGTANAPTQ